MKGKKDNFSMENALFREIKSKIPKSNWEMEGRNHYRNEERQVTVCSDDTLDRCYVRFWTYLKRIHFVLTQLVHPVASRKQLYNNPFMTKLNWLHYLLELSRKSHICRSNKILRIFQKKFHHSLLSIQNTKRKNKYKTGYTWHVLKLY